MSLHETEEVKEVIPESIRLILWFMLQELDKTSPDHHFELSILEVDGEMKQHIIHTQKNISYRWEFSYKFPTPINLSAYIIGFGKDDWLMLLQP